MNTPPLDAFVALIRTRDRRVGLKLLYNKYDIKTKTDRKKITAAWDALAAKMDDVYRPEESGMSALNRRRHIITAVEAARRERKKGRKKKYRSEPEPFLTVNVAPAQTTERNEDDECRVSGESAGASDGAGSGTPSGQTV